MTAAEKLQRAVQCLRDIVHPMTKFEREVRPYYQLDGWACVQLIKDPMTYREWAQKALEEMGEEGTQALPPTLSS